MTEKKVKSCFSVNNLISTSELHAEHRFGGLNTHHAHVQVLVIMRSAKMNDYQSSTTDVKHLLANHRHFLNRSHTMGERTSRLFKKN